MTYRISIYALCAILAITVIYKAVNQPEYEDCNRYLNVDPTEGLVEPPPPVEVQPPPEVPNDKDRARIVELQRKLDEPPSADDAVFVATYDERVRRLEADVLLFPLVDEGEFEKLERKIKWTREFLFITQKRAKILTKEFDRLQAEMELEKLEHPGLGLEKIGPLRVLFDLLEDR